MKISDKESVRQHVVGATDSLLTALERINSLSGEAMTLFVESEGRIVGSLTDGDIRRSLLAGAVLDAPVSTAMHRGFRALRPGCDRFSLAREAAAVGADLLPVLDSEGRLESIFDLRHTHSLLPLEGVLMAGGRGERLRPLTDKTPKPLLPIGGRPIIDHNVSALEDNGVERIFITVNYLKEQLIGYFAERRNMAEVVCVEEPAPLGTIGSLSLLPPLRQPDLLLMNSDLFTTIDYSAMYEHHKRSGAALTMGVVPYVVSVPFAIIETGAEGVKGLKEKPTYNYLANAGVYIMRSELLSRLEKGKRADAPDFIEALIADGERVEHFPITGTWVDIGTPDDYRNACNFAK